MTVAAPIRAATVKERFPEKGRNQRRAWSLLQKVHDSRLSGGGIRGRVSVDFPGLAGRLPVARGHPLPDRVVRLVHEVVRTAMDADGGFAHRRFSRVYLARGFKRARDLHTEVAQDRRAGLSGVVIEENVVTV